MTGAAPGGEGRADLRVALLTNCLSPHTLPLCEAMSTRVQEFRAFLSADGDSFHKFPKVEASFPVTLQRSFNALRFRRRDHGFWATNQLHIPFDTFQQLRDYQPDVILSSQFGIRTMLSTLYRLRYPTTRLFVWANVSTHTEQRRAWYRRALRKWLLRNLDGALVNGAEGESYLRALSFKGPISFLPYTIDETLFRRSTRYSPKGGALRLLYCGRLDSCKGVLIFSEHLVAWCEVHPDIKIEFEAVGDGPEGAALRSLQVPSNLTISVLPRMDQSGLATRYHQADLFVLPTFADEWAVVVNEAMLAGLPVLGSIYSQAVTEIVVDGASGWLFDPEREGSIRSALDRALTSSRESLCAMSESATRRMDLFSPEMVASRTVRVMESVVRRELSEGNIATPEPISLAPKSLA